MKYMKDQNGTAYEVVDEQEFYESNQTLFTRPCSYEYFEKHKTIVKLCDCCSNYYRQRVDRAHCEACQERYEEDEQ